MDFVYDKPIFTQWTFAPAEPQTKKKAHGHGHSEKAHKKKAHQKKAHKKRDMSNDKSLNKFDGISAAIIKGKTRIVNQFLRSHNTFGTESLSAQEKKKFVNWLVDQNFNSLTRDELEDAKQYPAMIEDWRRYIVRLPQAGH